MPPSKKPRVPTPRVSAGTNLASAMGKNLEILAKILPAAQFERLRNAAAAAESAAAGSATTPSSNKSASPIVAAAMSSSGKLLEDASITSTALSSAPTTPTDGGNGPAGGSFGVAAATSTATPAVVNNTFTKVNQDGPLTLAHLEAHNNKERDAALLNDDGDCTKLHQSFRPSMSLKCGEGGVVGLLNGEMLDGVPEYKGGANATEPSLGAVAMESPMLRAGHLDPEMATPPAFYLFHPRGSSTSEGGLSAQTPATPVDLIATPTPGGVGQFPSNFGSTFNPTAATFSSTVAFQQPLASQRGEGASAAPFSKRVSIESESMAKRPTVGYVEDTRSVLSSRVPSMSREPSPIAGEEISYQAFVGATPEFLDAHRRDSGRRRSGTVVPLFNLSNSPALSHGDDGDDDSHAFRSPSPLDAENFMSLGGAPLSSQQTGVFRSSIAPLDQPQDQHQQQQQQHHVPAPFLSLEDTNQLVSTVAEVRGALSPPIHIHWVCTNVDQQPFLSQLLDKRVVPCTPSEMAQWTPPSPEYPTNSRLKAAEDGQIFRRLERSLSSGDVDAARGIFMRFPETDVLEGYNVFLDEGISALYDGTRTQRIGSSGVLPTTGTNAASSALLSSNSNGKRGSSSSLTLQQIHEKKSKEVMPPEMDVFSGKSERGTAVWIVEAINARRDDILELLLWQFERSLPQPADVLPPLPPPPHPSCIASSASLMASCGFPGGGGARFTNESPVPSASGSLPPSDPFLSPFPSRSELCSPIHHQSTDVVTIPRIDVPAFIKVQCYNRRRRKQLSGIVHAARVYGLANFKISEEALAHTAPYVTVTPLMRLPGDVLTDEDIATATGLNNNNSFNRNDEFGPAATTTARGGGGGGGGGGDSPPTVLPPNTNPTAERIIDRTLEFIGEFADYEKGLFGSCYGFDEDGEETFVDMVCDDYIAADFGDSLAGSASPSRFVGTGSDSGNEGRGTPPLPLSTMSNNPLKHNSGLEGSSSIIPGCGEFLATPEVSSPRGLRCRSPSFSPGGGFAMGGGGGGADYPATLLAFAMHYLGLTPQTDAHSGTSINANQQTIALSHQTITNVLEAVDANTLALIDLERSALEKNGGGDSINDALSPLNKSNSFHSTVRSTKGDPAAAASTKHPHDIWFPGLTSPCFWDRFPDTASLDFYLGQRLEVYLTLLRLQQIWYEQLGSEQQQQQATNNNCWPSSTLPQQQQPHSLHPAGDMASDPSTGTLNEEIIKRVGSNNTLDEHRSSTPHRTMESPYRARSVSLGAAAGGNGMPPPPIPLMRKLSVFGSPMGSMRRFSFIGASNAGLSPVAQSLTPRGGQLRRSESMHSVQSTSTLANASFTSYSAMAPAAVFSRKHQLSALSTGTMDQHLKALKLEEAIERIRSRQKVKKSKKSKVKAAEEAVLVEDLPLLHEEDLRAAAQRIASTVAINDDMMETRFDNNNYTSINNSASFVTGSGSFNQLRKYSSALFCNAASAMSNRSSAAPSPLMASKNFGGSSLRAGNAMGDTSSSAATLSVSVTPTATLLNLSASVIDAVERRHFQSILQRDDIQTLRNRLTVTCKEETTIVSLKQPMLTAEGYDPVDEKEVGAEVSLPASFEMEVMNLRSSEYVRQYVPPKATTATVIPSL